MNRLATERSPYLLQHAANPVDWYAWGDEAFARAREASRPIFLSVGYSTCHWCHVMERESFENQAVASVLNEHFVSIKVDREERPDVDRVYMMFVQATTGSGGWPMSVWLTPDLRPFYGGTYFPPSSRWGRPGFTEILQEIARVWRDERGQVEQSAGNLVERLRTLERTKPVWTVPDASALSRTVGQFRGAFDHRFGGFGEAPKFPRPSELLFLMREHARTGDPDAREMALETLRAMALGGMRDHIGGGFHRYSVDGQWRVPHFEKMLYDQAQLVLAYAEASQLSGDVSYAEIAEDTLRYVLREMTDSLGGFYSAEDADSLPPDSSSAEHKMEGAFYLWRAAEVESLFGKDDAGVVKLRFGIEADGNAPHDPQHEFTGKNLLYIARSIDEIAPEAGRTPSEVIDILNGARVRLFEERLKRPRPDRDEKILSAWNGLMIAALARMGRLLRGSSAYLDAARRAATFMRERMWNPTSRSLARRYRQGQAEIDGFAEDYAFVTFGLLELFQADPDPAWLEWAVTLQRRLDELFWDDAEGGWFSTTGKDPSVLLRLKDEYDGAEPTASSVAVLNLLTLTHLVHEPVWVDRIERTLRLFGSRLDQMGRAVPLMGAALSSYLAGTQQIVIVDGPDGNDESHAEDGADALERVVAGRYLPFAITLHVKDEKRQALESVLPEVAAMQPVGGVSAVYVCRDFVCRQPITNASELEAELARAQSDVDARPRVQ